MTKKREIYQQLKQNYLFAVIRGNNQEEAISIAKACIAGGIKNIEITYTTPDATEVIHLLKKEYIQTSVLVGAGTVLDELTARQAILAGADFIVSPHLDLDIITTCHRYSIPYFPGCCTPTEITTALNHGIEIVKLFPAGLLGPSFIKDIHGPLPHAEMMPSGGVDFETLEAWIKVGSWAVGIGSILTKHIATEGYASVERASKEIVSKTREILQHE
ncbi:bifunctional 2-keto-4-hydroxyglutarate aldolase/2-keto-3-deoxy-6-phosphogluconate aldolase [Vagococcus fluvialis]|uniref:bifunctional 2-keto-4-hydroxyglutarate aldolase/2-keto-3-deoxy-6-phosphogluconate aldolase n=1 Tax=Vagococcus fluvialis TaxID=2738 RepID=UPI003B5B4818